MTAFQITILQAWAHGLSAKEIAYILHVSINTVEDRTKRLKKELGAKSISHAVAIGMRTKIID